MNEIKCKICDLTMKFPAVGNHLARKHGVSARGYFDKYIKKEFDSICKICNKNTDFIGIKHGYKIMCPEHIKFNRPICKEYWIVNYRLSEQEAIEKVKKEQSIRSRKFTGKRLSHFSMEYWTNKGLSEKDAKIKVSEIQKKNSKKSREKRLLTPEKYKDCHGYSVKNWMNKGMTEEEALIKIEELRENSRHSLEKSMERYGEIDGKKHWENFKQTRGRSLKEFKKLYGKTQGEVRWNQYMIKRSIVFERMNSRGWSNISQELFWKIYEKIKHKSLDIFFATLDNNERNNHCNKEYVVRITKSKFHRLDFYIESLKKCIEYDCDRFHEEVRDKIRENNIKNVIPEIKIFRVNHSEYIKSRNKELILNKCVSFLLEDNSEV